MDLNFQGSRVVAEGVVGEVGGHLAMMNPDYEFLAGPEGMDDN